MLAVSLQHLNKILKTEMFPLIFWLDSGFPSWADLGEN